ncbi:NAD(P)-binding protein [Bradyrhizobium arachidis]|uniref:NAD(P)-binding protein n=1 Tax=Bradyrhizobium arachidis TaxID=858423 RepID=UPI00216165A4|nr:NAD(P)-binding protein [Bradyrhizobium arachidis]UVO27601.1 NAD(P)-binding protein [Bradyrhizobium arachidis]
MARKKIAILGGGVAALSSAFELTELDPLHELFDITVYTIGWRLGGKGAVGRDEAKGYRAEEHGLHIWTGFYDNAFELVDRVYAAMDGLGLSPPFESREQAFEGLDRSVLMEPSKQAWISWTFDIPPHEGIPGTPRPAFFSLVDFLRSLLECAVHQTRSIAGFTDQWPQGVAPSFMATGAGDGPFGSARARIDALPLDPKAISARQSEELRTLLRLSRIQLRRKAKLAKMASDPRKIVAEITLTIAIGMLKDGVLWQGFDCIDDFEWTKWMKSRGCSSEALDSAVVRGCYDYVFGFFGTNPYSTAGTVPRRDVAAGTGTRILLKLLFTYRGSFFYLLRATMGELLFAPLYQVLSKRRVNFEFFTKVEQIGLSQDKASIETIETTIQATTHSGKVYDPLIWIGQDEKLASWPSHPDYAQLVQGNELRKRRIDLESAWTDWTGVRPRTLTRGTDFDDIVLGIGIGAFDTICKDLVYHKPKWKQMVDAVKTTATVAFQAWTTVGMRELGCKHDRTALSGFELPLDTWADLSLMLPLEEWPLQHAPKGLAYFVGCLVDDQAAPTPPFSDHTYPARKLAQEQSSMLAWIKAYLPFLWPGIIYPNGTIRWDRFFDYRGPYAPPTQERFAAQYSRVNINPSDRYVLSVAGSMFKRMRADESGLDNLYLAGDWVRTGINAGCIEASVMAGRAAAAAIAGVHIAMPNANDFDDVSLPTALLPAFDFLRKVGTNAVAGTGEIEAFCVVQSLPFEFVEGKLPDGLALYTPATPPGKLTVETHGKQYDQKESGTSEQTTETPVPKKPDTHEIVLIFARQRNVRPGLVPFGGARYLEIAQLIPDVVHKDSHVLPNVLFSYMPHLLVDSVAAVLIGQRFYGFNKQVANIREDGDSFSVRSPTGTIRSWFNRDGLPGGIASFPRIATIRDKLQQPLVGVQPDGNFIYSVLKYGLAGAVFQPIKGSIELLPPFVKDKPSKPISLNAMTESGAQPYPWGFRFMSPWTLTLPFNFPNWDSGPTEKNLARATGEYSKALLGRLLVRR